MLDQIKYILRTSFCYEYILMMIFNKRKSIKNIVEHLALKSFSRYYDIREAQYTCFSKMK